MKDIQIYSAQNCSYCDQAKILLQSAGLPFVEFDVTADRPKIEEMVERSGRRTVPQIIIDGVPVGGYEELTRLRAAGYL